MYIDAGHGKAQRLDDRAGSPPGDAVPWHTLYRATYK